MKKLIALALSLCIVGGSAPAALEYAADYALTASAADIVDSGECGENVTWTLDSEGTLTISGEGDMTNYDWDVSPFNSNYNIKSVIIENGVTSIGYGAFYGCQSLSSVTIPDSVASIGYDAFSDCTSLTSINVDENNQNYKSIDGVLFDKNADTIICYPAEKTDKSYAIPDSVTSICDWAFSHCVRLTSITIPDSVTSIGYDTFYHCTSLESVNIGNSVTSIGYGAFYNCTSLTSITILNPDCNIYDEACTISNRYDSEKGGDYFDGTIYGYANSTAQAYAEKYGYTFVALDAEPGIAGDINGDGEVTVADATYIMQWAAAPDEYPLSDTAKKNGDVTGGDGVTTSDALAIQQYLSGVISALPVE